jgi:hypothetical protein
MVRAGARSSQMEALLSACPSGTKAHSPIEAPPNYLSAYAPVPPTLLFVVQGTALPLRRTIVNQEGCIGFGGVYDRIYFDVLIKSVNSVSKEVARTANNHRPSLLGKEVGIHSKLAGLPVADATASYMAAHAAWSVGVLTGSKYPCRYGAVNLAGFCRNQVLVPHSVSRTWAISSRTSAHRRFGETTTAQIA